jgi:hypothetical protein
MGLPLSIRALDGSTPSIFSLLIFSLLETHVFGSAQTPSPSHARLQTGEHYGHNHHLDRPRGATVTRWRRILLQTPRLRRKHRSKQQPGHDILVFGSVCLVESLMGADLIDEYRLSVHPIMMGSGRRAFKDGMTTTKLTLGETTRLSSGVISLCYQRAQK